MFLIIQVYEADQEHRTRVMELQDRLTVLEAEASKHQDVLNATVSQHKMQITRLTEDKAMLEVYPPTCVGRDRIVLFCSFICYIINKDVKSNSSSGLRGGPPMIALNCFVVFYVGLFYQ